MYTLFFCFCFCLCPFFFCFAFVFLPILVVKKLPLAVQQTSLAEEKDMEYTVNTFAEPNNLKSNKRIANY